MKKRFRASLELPLVVAAAVLLTAGAGVFARATSRSQNATDASAPSFSAERLLTHIRVLSSNEFQGRGPGTEGETKTIA
jgi:flagellar basal body-associated protein FliL